MRKTPKVLVFDISDVLPTTVAAIEMRRMDGYESDLIRPDAVAWKDFLKGSDTGIIYGLYDYVKDLRNLVILNSESVRKLIDTFERYLKTKLSEHIGFLVPDYKLSEDILDERVIAQVWKVTLGRFADNRNPDESPSLFVSALSEAYSVIELLDDNVVDVKFCLVYTFNKIKYHVFVRGYPKTKLGEFNPSLKNGRFCT